MDSTPAEPVAGTQDVVGEGPWWAADTATLWWLDIRARRLNQLAGTGTGVARSPCIELPAGSTAVLGTADPDQLSVVGSGGVFVIEPSSCRTRRNLPLGWLDTSRYRASDATTDCFGRIWIGWFRHDRRRGHGTVGVIDSGILRPVVENLTMPNGIGWLPDGQTLVVADSITGDVLEIPIDLERCTIAAAPRKRVTIGQSVGMPDGIAVDREGAVWVAVWGAGAVNRYAPSGLLLESITIPASLPASCAFGGENRRTLYITTASYTLESPSANDGALYCTEVKMPGLDVLPHSI
jgi:sugar lactone lactonase YvrE